MNGVFRSQARNASDVEPFAGELLRLTSPWVPLAGRALAAITALSLLAVLTLDIDETVSGPSVVRMEGATSLTSPRAGLVDAVLVRPGDAVQEGTPLVRLVATTERANLTGVLDEHDVELARTLRDPTDTVAHARLATLTADLALARTRFEQSVVRSPHAGTVSDVRIRGGQPLAAGDPLVAIEGPNARPKLVAFLPGHARPRLHAGARVRLELAGYRFAYQELVLASAGERLIGPNEARRFLGLEVGDTIPVEGALVIATADLPPDFDVDGSRFKYAEGMSGTALIPSLRTLFWRR